MFPRRDWGNTKQREADYLGVKPEACSLLVNRGWGAQGSPDPTVPPSPLSAPALGLHKASPLPLLSTWESLADSRLTLNPVFNYS